MPVGPVWAGAFNGRNGSIAGAVTASRTNLSGGTSNRVDIPGYRVARDVLVFIGGEWSRRRGAGAVKDV